MAVDKALVSFISCPFFNAIFLTAPKRPRQNKPDQTNQIGFTYDMAGTAGVNRILFLMLAQLPANSIPLRQSKQDKIILELVKTPLTKTAIKFVVSMLQ